MAVIRQFLQQLWSWGLEGHRNQLQQPFWALKFQGWIQCWHKLAVASLGLCKLARGGSLALCFWGPDPANSPLQHFGGLQWESLGTREQQDRVVGITVLLPGTFPTAFAIPQAAQHLHAACGELLVEENREWGCWC